MKTFAVIPTKFESMDTLRKLIQNIHADNSIFRAYVLDNSGNEPLGRNTMKIRELSYPNYTIYEMWNSARRYIQDTYPKEELNIAFLNDDIELKDNALSLMSRELRREKDVAIVFPDPTVSWDSGPTGTLTPTDTTFGAGGMTGFCFMMKGELDIPYVDENLKLYWGDDDLVKQTIAKGYKICRIDGLPIQHIGSVTINKMNYTQRIRMMGADRTYFNTKYNENRSPVL
jgi:hypothetical protein